MKIITEKLQNLWSSDEVRILVLTSLGIQIGLIFLAPLRKRITNMMLALTLWLLYLTADNVATLGLGNISHQTPAGSGVSSELTVLWAPFLLVHLGGPDTITSYSIEDNELWWRHLLGLIFQVIITVYVFFQSPPTGWLWIPTIFVFIPGLIKFAERTHALRLASKDNLKDKIISELRPGTMRGSTKNTSNGVQANATTRGSGSTEDTSNAVQANATTRGRWSNLMGKIKAYTIGTWDKIKAVLFPPENTTSNAVPANETTEGSTENTTSNAVQENETTRGSTENTTSNAVQENETTRVSNENTTSNAVNQANGTTKGRWSNLMGKIKAVLFPPEDTIDNLVETSVISEDESQAIYEGFRWFNIFKRLLVDVTFDADLLMKSQDRFSDLDSTDALKLVAIELSFLYDVLHTKAVHMHCISGRVLRYFSLASIIAALVVFHHLDKQKYVSGDIIITYILFGAGLSLEVIATMLLVFSDWTVVALTRTELSKCVVSCIIESVKGFFLKKGKPRWARTIGQFNLVGVCLRDRDTVLAKIMGFLKIKHLWDNMRESRSIPLLRGKLEEIMFTEAKRRAQNVHIYNVLLEARSYRGGKALERHGQLKSLEWSMKRDFDESIILWHLATDICYYNNDTSNQPNRNGSDVTAGNNDTERETSNQPKGNNETEGETSNQPRGNNKTEGETSNQPKGNNETERETSNQPKGENQEPSNQPNGENQEPSNQPNGRKNCWSLPKRKVQPKEDTERGVSWKTSNYMVYLLTQQQSMMQLGYGKTRFEATCAVAKKIFQGKRELEELKKKAHEELKKKAREELKKAREQLNKEREELNKKAPVAGQNDALAPGDSRQSLVKKIWTNLRHWGRRKDEEEKRKDEEEMGKLVLRNGLRLAEELQKVEPEIKRWQLISETWMEMLGYAAIHCDSYQHAKSLSRGGELLTHLWLLMSQLGVVEEHKMQQYQSDYTV